MSEATRKNGLKIFCCYALEDLEHLRDLRTHLLPLEREGLATTWADTDINMGADREKEIGHHLWAAQIILLLISPDFLASNSTEMAQAMERHRRGEVCVTPIILRPSDWQSAPFGKLQALPKNMIPITAWRSRDEAWKQVAQEVRIAVKELEKQPPANQPAISSSGSPPSSPLTLSERAKSSTAQQSQLRPSTSETKPGKPSSKTLLLSFLAFLVVGGLIYSVYPHLMGSSITPLANPTSVSTLIPPKGQVVLDDPLNNKRNPHVWSTGSSKVGNLTCALTDTGYRLSAPKGSGGNGCGPEFPPTNAHLTNFVYQIQMVINQGGSDLETGPTFCWYASDGYRLDFNPGGGWELFFGYQTPLTGVSQYFRGIGRMNTITVRVTKNQIDAQVNGYTLFSLPDPQHSEGQIGVNLGPGGEENADVTFTNAKVWLL